MLPLLRLRGARLLGPARRRRLLGRLLERCAKLDLLARHRLHCSRHLGPLRRESRLELCELLEPRCLRRHDGQPELIAQHCFRLLLALGGVDPCVPIGKAAAVPVLGRMGVLESATRLGGFELALERRDLVQHLPSVCLDRLLQVEQLLGHVVVVDLSVRELTLEIRELSERVAPLGLLILHGDSVLVHLLELAPRLVHIAMRLEERVREPVDFLVLGRLH